MVDSQGRSACLLPLKCVALSTDLYSIVLRLYPSIPANDRVSKRDTFLPRGAGVDGEQPVFVPAGCVIDLHIWALQRDHSIWGESADQFCPERWEGRSGATGFMAFGAGSRTCPGREYITKLHF